jgi:hypothetical protein
MSARVPHDPRALSQTIARGERLHASRVPDEVLAAAAEERSLGRLRRRITRWQRLHRIH